MFAGTSQLIRARSQIIQAEARAYSQLTRAGEHARLQVCPRMIAGRYTYASDVGEQQA